jgi:hypothetical protein
MLVRRPPPYILEQKFTIFSLKVVILYNKETLASETYCCMVADDNLMTNLASKPVCYSCALCSQQITRLNIKSPSEKTSQQTSFVALVYSGIHCTCVHNNSNNSKSVSVRACARRVTEKRAKREGSKRPREREREREKEDGVVPTC